MIVNPMKIGGGADHNWAPTMKCSVYMKRWMSSTNNLDNVWL